MNTDYQSLIDENERLELELETLRASLELVGLPGIDRMAKEVAQLRVENRRLKNELSTYQIKTLPDGKMLSAQISDGQQVWKVLPGDVCAIEYNIEVLGSGWANYHGTAFYAGNHADFERKILDPFRYHLQGWPIDDDVAGDWSEPLSMAGLPKSDFLEMCQALVVFRNIPSLNQYYESRRQEIFNYTWDAPDGMAAWLKEYQRQHPKQYRTAISRREIFKVFKQRTDRTFEKMDRRLRANSNIGGVQDFVPTTKAP